MPPSVDTTTAAIEHARAVREQYRRTDADDPERAAALTAALGSLRDSWSPNLTAHCRSGRQVGRAVSDDPVRVAARERRAELARLRAALNRTSGTPRDERAPEEGGTLPAWSHVQMRGRLRRFAQVLGNIDAQHRSTLNVVGRGDGYAGMSTLRTEAADWLDKLREERRRVQVRWTQYERREVVSDPRNPYADSDEAEDLAHLLALLRQHADELTAALRRSATTTRPLPDSRKREPWTTQTARGSLRGFEVAHGRRPRKADCGPENGLPHYTQLRRLLGPRPLGG